MPPIRVSDDVFVADMLALAADYLRLIAADHRSHHASAHIIKRFEREAKRAEQMSASMTDRTLTLVRAERMET